MCASTALKNNVTPAKKLRPKG